MICTALEISARKYSSTAELLAAAAERRKRLTNPARRPRNAAPQLVYNREAEERARAEAEAEAKAEAASLEQMRKEQMRKEMEERAYRSGHGRDWRAFIALRAADFSLTYQEVVSRSRAKAIVHARAVIMYEIHETGLKSLPEIGRMFGRDHTSVLFAVRKIKAQMENDPAALAWFEAKTRRTREYFQKWQREREAGVSA